MNTNELRCILTRDSKIQEQLKNVFALDQFKDYVKENTLVNGIYVCNDEILDKPGNHWFLIHVDKFSVNFVDSFAKEPSYYSIQDEVKSTKRFNNVPFQLQSFFSDVCGEYAIFFSYHLSRSKTLEEIVKYFSKSVRVWNDECVRNFVHKLFPGHTR